MVFANRKCRDSGAGIQDSGGETQHAACGLAVGRNIGDEINQEGRKPGTKNSCLLRFLIKRTTECMDGHGCFHFLSVRIRGSFSRLRIRLVFANSIWRSCADFADDNDNCRDFGRRAGRRNGEKQGHFGFGGDVGRPVDRVRVGKSVVDPAGLG